MFVVVIKPTSYDLWVMAKLAGALGRYPRFDLAVEALTSFGIFGGLGFSAVLFVLWTESQRPGREALRRLVFRAILAMIISAGLSVLAGQAVHWVPPVHHPVLRSLYPGYLETNPNPSSFPSQSTAVCAAIAASLYAVSAGLGTLLWAGVVVFVAAPRVFLGGHYPTDVVAGVACGLAGFLLAAAAVKVIGPYEQLEKRRLTRWITFLVCFAAMVQLAVDFRDVAGVWKAYSTAVSPHSLSIGGDSHFGQYFKGIIDEVRIYNRALTLVEVQHDMSTPIGSLSRTEMPDKSTSPGLVAAFSCDEGAGDKLYDLSGHGNLGVLQGVTWSPIAKYGKALAFDGQSKVEVADSPTLHLQSAFTLEAWVFPTSAPSGWSDLVYKEIDSYYLAASSSRNTPAAGGEILGPGREVFGSEPLPQNTWTYLTAIYDGRGLRLLINGKDTGAQ